MSQASAQYHKTPRLSARSRFVAPVTSPLLTPESPPPKFTPLDSRIHSGPPPLLEKGFVPVAIEAEIPAKKVVPKPAQSRKLQASTKKRQHRHTLECVDNKKTPPASSVPAVSSAPPLKASKKPQVIFPQDLKASASTRKSKRKPNADEAGFYPVGYSPYLPAAIYTQSGKHQAALSYYNQGSHYGRTNQLNEAIQAYQKAIQSNPNLADAYVGLSSAYLLKHGWEDVFLNADKALTLKAGFIDAANITQAQFNLSMAHCALGKSHKAYKFYKKVKKAQHPQREGLSLYLEKNCKR